MEAGSGEGQGRGKGLCQTLSEDNGRVQDQL